MLEPEIVMEKDPRTIPALRKKGKLLVADDDQAIQKVLSTALSSMGYDVSLAGNGLEAMTLFLTSSYDLVMTDLGMPLMNGWELSRLVKEQSPSTPVIVMTGTNDDNLWEKLNTNSLNAMILKPFKLEEIEQTVLRLLNNGT
jgi:two-component system capsular synthesis sensor histidine kinase RcsC